MKLTNPSSPFNKIYIKPFIVLLCLGNPFGIFNALEPMTGLGVGAHITAMVGVSLDRRGDSPESKSGLKGMGSLGVRATIVVSPAPSRLKCGWRRVRKDASFP